MVQPSSIVPAADTARPELFLSRLRQLAECDGVGIFAEGGWVAQDGTKPPSDFSRSFLRGFAQAFPQGTPSRPDLLLTAPIPVIDESRPLWMVLWGIRPRSEVANQILLLRVAELVGQSAMARRRAAERHRQNLLERVSATARIGIWSCSLPDQRITWTNGVYDLFELPRGSLVDRDTSLKMYVPESAAQMQALRAEAIATCGDFNFDAQIITALCSSPTTRLHQQRRTG